MQRPLIDGFNDDQVVPLICLTYLSPANAGNFCTGLFSIFFGGAATNGVSSSRARLTAQRAGAPWSMNTGTIASPWRHDESCRSAHNYPATRLTRIYARGAR
jgi:hypothetical protein